jgi:hypothetical protein
MKRITGTVSVLGAIFWIIAIIYFSLEVYQTKDTETALEMLGMIVFLLSVLHICFFSKFWKKNKSNTGVSGTDDTSTFNEIRKEELQNTKKAKHKPFKSLATFSNSVSAIALLFSALSIYFQFFNEIHAVSYSSLSPDYDEKSKQITFPVLFKNTGNRTETILDTELQIEKGLPDNHFFKKISSLKSNEAYLILSPGESKKIDLVGNYEDYFSGTIGFTKQEGYKYFPSYCWSPTNNLC